MYYTGSDRESTGGAVFDRPTSSARSRSISASDIRGTRIPSELALRVSHEVARVQRRQPGRVVGGEPEAAEAEPAAVVHLARQRDDGGVAAPQGRRVPAAGGEHDQRVEHLLVEAGGVGERSVAALDRGGEPAAQRRIGGELVGGVG